MPSLTLLLYHSRASSDSVSYPAVTYIRNYYNLKVLKKTSRETLSGRETAFSQGRFIKPWMVPAFPTPARKTLKHVKHSVAGT